MESLLLAFDFLLMIIFLLSIIRAESKPDGTLGLFAFKEERADATPPPAEPKQRHHHHHHRHHGHRHGEH